MNKFLLTGRILFALPFGIFGLNHFLITEVFVGQMTSFIPGAGFTVILTGMALIAACTSIIINKYVRLSCILLAVLLLLFILSIHIPNLIYMTDKALPMINLLKDTSLLGGALMIAGLSEEEKSK